MLRLALEPLHVRVALRSVVQEAEEVRRQRDPANAHLDALGEDPAAIQVRHRIAGIDVVRRERDLAVEHGRHAAGGQQVDLGVRVEAPVDLVVVDLDFGIPAVDELREVRERQPRHRHLRRQLLAALRRRHVDDDVLDAHRVARRLLMEDRGVCLAVLSPRDARLGRAGSELARPGREPAIQHVVLARGDRLGGPRVRAFGGGRRGSQLARGFRVGRHGRRLWCGGLGHDALVDRGIVTRVARPRARSRPLCRTRRRAAARPSRFSVPRP